MADPKGFLKYGRKDNPMRPIMQRIKDFDAMELDLDDGDRRQQAARCMNCGIPFCHHGVFYGGGRAVAGCPNDNLIPEWNDLVYQSRDQQAFERLTKTNYLPDMTGRVCPAPCEAACVQALNGPGITIRNNEKFIIEQGFKYGWVVDSGKPLHRTGKKIAVIGSGPAGISVAWRLNQLGHSVTIFERDDRFGGLLMYGIPNMKLPKTSLNAGLKPYVKLASSWSQILKSARIFPRMNCAIGLTELSSAPAHVKPETLMLKVVTSKGFIKLLITCACRLKPS